jgi:hypothetical protein
MRKDCRGNPCGCPFSTWATLAVAHHRTWATARVAPTVAHPIIVLGLLLTTLPQKAAQLPR